MLRKLLFEPITRVVIIVLIQLAVGLLYFSSFKTEGSNLVDIVIFLFNFLVLPVMLGFLLGKLNIFIDRRNYFISVVSHIVIYFALIIPVVITYDLGVSLISSLLFVFVLPINIFPIYAMLDIGDFSYSQMIKNHAKDAIAYAIWGDSVDSVGFLINKDLKLGAVSQSLIKDKLHTLKETEKVLFKKFENIVIILSKDLLDTNILVSAKGSRSYELKIDKLSEFKNDLEIKGYTMDASLNNSINFPVFFTTSESLSKEVKIIKLEPVGLINEGVIIKKEQFSLKNPSKLQSEHALKKEDFVISLPETYILSKVTHNLRGKIKEIIEMKNPFTKQELYKLICEVDAYDFEIIGNKLSILNCPRVGDFIECSVDFYDISYE